MAAIKPGDYLTPKPIWNAAMRYDTLPDSVQVIGTQTNARSESGVLVKVETTRGDAIWLDSNWFVEVGGEGERP